jgi:hypothetical protein
MMCSPSFCVFGDNTFSNRSFAWAASIHPRSEVVHQICSNCGSVKYYPKGAFDVTLEKGSKYPDVLGCGAYPFLIVSGKVIEAWQEAGICCYHTYDVKIAEIKSAKLKDLTAPKYYRVEIDGSCLIDIEASGAKVVNFCPECHHLVTHPSVLNSFSIATGSWDGSSLFRDQVHYPMISFCTDTIVKIAFQYRLTNFRFEPMAGPLDPGNKAIDYLAGHT